MLRSAHTLATTAGWTCRRLKRSKREATVGFIGGHGGSNLGDDMMVRIARSLFPDWRLVDYAASWHEKRLARMGLSGPPYFNRVLLGGGTLISPFWYGKVETAVQQGLPIASLGTGAGSCGFIQKDDIDLSQWVPLLRSFDYLGVRGPRSQTRLRAIGVNHAEVVGDLAFHLTRPAATAPSEQPSLAVNLAEPGHDEPACGEAARFDELAAALAPLVKTGWTLMPYAMHGSDIQPTQRLLARLGLAERTVPHLRSVDAFFDYVGPAWGNIAVRLHGAVLGCCLGVPPMMLGYRDKCLDVAESLDLADWCLSLPKAERGDVHRQIERIGEGALPGREDVRQRAERLKKRLEAYTNAIAAHHTDGAASDMNGGRN